MEGEAYSGVANLVNNCSIALTVEWSLVAKLLRLERSLGSVIKGWSRDCLVEVELAE